MVSVVEYAIHQEKRTCSCRVNRELLVVDDEEAICEGCRRIFSRQGFDVEKCSDACQGLVLATQSDYSAILLDIKMPGMDGIHFLEALRKQKPTTPVVLMTGYPSIPNAASADSAGRLRLRDEAVHAGGNLPGRASPAAARGDGAAAARAGGPTPPPRPQRRFRFYAMPGIRAGEDGAVRVGALVVRPGVAKIESSACRGSAKWSTKDCRWPP